MKELKLYFVMILYISHSELCVAENIFPKDFKFGVASAAYQVEGGWNADDKGESIWDKLTHEHPELIKDHGTGDIACDSYHLWADDIDILKHLAVDYYRFSLSWPRILPSGLLNHISTEGVKYYNKIIDKLLENGIKPVVTLYHWDLPQALQELGGWTSEQTAEYFAQYARVAFGMFGDRVKIWITINEPMSICEDTYGNNNGAPAISSPGIGDYLCGKTILLAHAKAYRVYDQEFREKQKGEIGITIDSIWCEPRTNSSEDREAAERQLQMSLGWWAHPIFSKNGDYPEVMKSRIQNRSLMENFVESRLPPLSEDEIKNIKGTADFFGLNHYHTWLISNHEYPIGHPSHVNDMGTSGYQDPNWKPNRNIVPWGFEKLLNWIRKEYDNPKVYVTENGYPDYGQLKDKERVIFYREFLKALLSAMNQGCNVKSYIAWSIMDNMEWREGYTIKFGLYQVNFGSPNRTRTPKSSAHFYKTVIETRKIPDDIDIFLTDR